MSDDQLADVGPMSSTQVNQAIAAEVIKAYRKNRNFFEAAEVIAKVREAGLATFRERYELLRTIERVRQLADELERESEADRSSAEDFDRGASWGREDTADRIREVLDR